MRNKFLIDFGTLLFIALFGSALHFAGQKPSLHPDAVAGATKNSLYGQRDYNAFLAGFAIPVSAIHFEVITLHSKEAAYVLLVNTKRNGGALLFQNMGKFVHDHPSLTVPVDRADPVYSDHTEQCLRFLAAKGYRFQRLPFDPLTFRSMVHSGHFDIILLEKRSLL